MTATAPLADFTEQLFLDGVANVEQWASATERDCDLTKKLLSQANELRVAEAPHQPPDFEVENALWAQQMLHWATCLYANRLDTNTQVPEPLRNCEPIGCSPSLQWSVDIGLRFLPGLMSLSHRFAAEDDLTQTMIELSQRWPLCWVAADLETNTKDEFTLPSIFEERLAEIIKHPCLRIVLIDRIIKHRNARLAREPSLQPFLDRAVGGQTQMFDWLDWPDASNDVRVAEYDRES